MQTANRVHFELDAEAPPASAQIIFLSTDTNGAPSQRSYSVGKNLGLDLQPPGKNLQTHGYEVISAGKEWTVVWIATSGDGASAAEHIVLRLDKVLRIITDFIQDRAPRFWMPLLGTGAGQVSSTLSLSVIINAFTKFAKANPGLAVNVTIVPRPDFSEAELASLRDILGGIPDATQSSLEPDSSAKVQTQTQRPIYTNIDADNALKAAQERMRDSGHYTGPIDGILSEDVITSIQLYIEDEHDITLENEGPWQALLTVFPDLPDQMHAAIDDHRTKYEALEDEYIDALNQPNDLTGGYHADMPIEALENDTLGRVAIADAIADNIMHVWPEHMNPDNPHPMAVHLSGRWGSGKSSILNFLRQKLEGDLRFAPDTAGLVNVKHKKGWVVAEFNAWRMQDAGEAWWSLCDNLIKAARTSMGAPVRGRRIYWRDLLWQRSKLWRPQLAIATFLLAIVFLWSGALWLQDASTSAPVEVTTTTQTQPNSTTTATSSTDETGVTTTVTTVVETPKAKDDKPPSIWQPLLTISAFLGGIGTLIGYIKGLNKTNAEVAEAIRDLQSEPDAELRHRYKRVVAEIGKPVAVFIDDLDRCRADYVVELLQGLQTAFSDVPVLYVIAADRDWIVSAYNQQFEGFKDEISKPGQPLGYLFVKKIFQLSVNVPDLAPLQAQTLTEKLLNGSAPVEENKLPAPEQRKQDIAAIDAAETIEDLKQVAREIGQARRSTTVSREIFAKVRAEAAQTEIAHALLDYSALFDGNPRAIKRLVNAMTFRTGYVLMAGANLSFDLIARYTILDLRFPYTAAHLAQFPAKVDPDKRDQPTEKAPAADAIYFHDATIDDILTGVTAKDIEDIRAFG